MRLVISQMPSDPLQEDWPVIATLAVRDGQIVTTGVGDDILRENQNVLLGTQRFTPADGEAWLRALWTTFRTGYLEADLQEE